MSLFKAREFWSTKCGDGEVFDCNSALVSKINTENDCIVLGSHSGFLRIYEPSIAKSSIDEQIGGYRATDLLLEQDLTYPVLQLGTGKLVSGSQSSQLAVLHPRKYVVYSLSIKAGATEHGTQHSLSVIYEHNLQRSAYDFVIAPFGGSLTRDFVCIQSLDGMLSFFEQESFAFCCFLSDFLLPEPFVYVPKTDSFVIATSKWTIECYKYKILHETGQNTRQSDTSGKRLTADWNFNIGENIVDMKSLTKFNESNVMVLGSRNLYGINDNGQLKFMKRLDYTPLCFHCYCSDVSNTIMTLIISETKTLLVYENTTLKWSAQLTIEPIFVARGFFKFMHGAVVLLDQEGELRCCYLGTQPSLFSAPPLFNKNIDFERAEVEMMTLSKIIKSHYNKDVSMKATATPERELIVGLTVSSHLEPSKYANESTQNVDNTLVEELQMCIVNVDILPNAPFEEVQVAMSVQQPLKVEPGVIFFKNFVDRRKIECHVYLDNPETVDVASLEVNCVVSYVTNLGVPRVVKKSSSLPLKLIMKSCPPFKDGEHKITLNLNRNPAPLSELFPEFMGENGLNMRSSAIGFKNVFSEGSVTVLHAKSSQRYRIQSDSITVLNVVVQEMVQRLHKHFRDDKEFALKFSSSLPIASLLSFIENHFEQARIVKELHANLSQLTAQYRLIQKRLISKFKDKNPVPLSNLELLITDTFSEIKETADNLEEAKKGVEKTQGDLKCVLNLILTLAKVMDVPSEVLLQIEALLQAPVEDAEGQSWEEIMDTALCYLLRTCLSKSEKDKLRAIHVGLEEMKDVSKFKKHFSQVLERVSKTNDMQAVAETEEPKKDAATTEVAEREGDDERKLEGEAGEKEDREFAQEKDAATYEKADFISIGSRLGTASSRVLSAKQTGLLSRRNRQIE